MKVFEIIKAFILSLPLGIFLSFALVVAVNSSMKLRKANALLLRVTGCYCFSASVASFMLLTYYYMPSLFALLDFLFPVSAVFSMVLFYHFFHYTIRSEVRFSPLHYLLPSLLFVILPVVKIVLPEIWVQEGVRVSLIAALFFGVVYSLLPLTGMLRYYVERTAMQGKPSSVNSLQVAVYIMEVILFPVVFVFFPLVGGQTPGILMASLLMASILLALKANIPFTYAMIRHYTSYDTRHRSLFDEITGQEEPGTLEKETGGVPEGEERTGYDISGKRSATTRKKVIVKKKVGEKPGKVLPPGFDKKVFHEFMHIRKPYLKPDLTINEVAKMLESNRTYVSRFINKAYEMNFSSYINLCRLREMNRLLKLAKNKERTPRELIPQTGFGTMRNYLRAKQQFGRQTENKGDEENKND